MSCTVTIRPTCTRRARSPRASPDAPSCSSARPTLRSAPLPAVGDDVLLEGSSTVFEVLSVGSEHDPAACRLRQLRWQAMEVRWEGARAEGDGRALCAPFVELGEAAMGEAAALCDAGGLLDEFRAAVLKLAGGAAAGGGRPTG